MDGRLGKTTWWVTFGVIAFAAILLLVPCVEYVLGPLLKTGEPNFDDGGLGLWGLAFALLASLVLVLPSVLVLLGFNAGLTALVWKFGHVHVRAAFWFTTIGVITLCVVAYVLWLLLDRYAFNGFLYVLLPCSFILTEILYVLGARKLIPAI